jgi:hypothetical protein
VARCVAARVRGVSAPLFEAAQDATACSALAASRGRTLCCCAMAIETVDSTSAAMTGVSFIRPSRGRVASDSGSGLSAQRAADPLMGCDYDIVDADTPVTPRSAITADIHN